MATRRGASSYQNFCVMKRILATVCKIRVTYIYLLTEVLKKNAKYTRTIRDNLSHVCTYLDMWIFSTIFIISVSAFCCYRYSLKLFKIIHKPKLSGSPEIKCTHKTRENTLCWFFCLRIWMQVEFPTAENNCWLVHKIEISVVGNIFRQHAAFGRTKKGIHKVFRAFIPFYEYFSPRLTILHGEIERAFLNDWEA